MKNQTTRTKVNGTTWVLFLLLILAVLISGRASAQRAPVVPQDFYFGVETTNGTRTFQMQSDLSGLSGLHVAQRGQTYGIILGSRLITGKIRVGSFSAAGKEVVPVQSSTFELGGNFNPLQLFKNKTKLVEPYLTISFDQASVKSSGMYTPPPSLVAPKSTSTCNCQCTGGSTLPTDPDQVNPTTPTLVNNTPVAYSGKIVTARLSMGVGMKIHLRKGNHFVNLFSEMKYGMALGTNGSTQALLNTSMLSQMAVDVGLSIGFISNKANKKVFRSRYR
jgi:hypothetical protein